MNCERIHPLFSDLLDGQLSGTLLDEVKAHLDGCDACGDEFGSFSLATNELRTLEPRALDEDQVAAVMAAVDAAGPATVLARGERPRKGVASHALMTLIGAAAAILIMLILDREDRPDGPRDDSLATTTTMTPVQETRDIEPPAAALRLVSGSGSWMRDGDLVEFDAAKPFQPRPGDVLRVEHGDGMTLQFGKDGAVVIEARPAEAPAPQIVERVVEKPTIIRRGPLLSIEFDSEPVAQAMDRVGASLDTVRSSLKEVADRPIARAPKTPAEAANVAQPDTADQVVMEAVPLDQPLSHEPEEAFGPVLVLRSGDRLTLQTSGPTYVVIPALIAHLDDEDQGVVDLAREQLESIRSELTTDPTIGERLEEVALAEPRNSAMNRFTDLFRSAEEKAAADAPLGEAETWSLWWEKNAMTVLEADTWGTF